jgi:hypothetical protein
VPSALLGAIIDGIFTLHQEWKPIRHARLVRMVVLAARDRWRSSLVKYAIPFPPTMKRIVKMQYEMFGGE